MGKETKKTHFDYELNTNFYFLFIEWPNNPVPERCWYTRDEKLGYMIEMSLDHLKASILLVENKIEHLTTSHDDKNKTRKILEPLARAKLKELKDVFKEKTALY